MSSVRRGGYDADGVGDERDDDEVRDDDDEVRDDDNDGDDTAPPEKGTN